MWVERQAVSPVIAVVLLVAVTVALSVTVGVFTLDLSESLSGGGSDAVSSINAHTTDGHVQFSVMQGSGLNHTDAKIQFAAGNQTVTLTNIKSDGSFSASGDTSLLNSSKLSGMGSDGSMDVGDTISFAINESAVTDSEDLSFTMVDTRSDTLLVSTTVRDGASTASTTSSETVSQIIFGTTFGDGDSSNWTSISGDKNVAASQLLSQCSGTSNTSRFTRSVGSVDTTAVTYNMTITAIDSWDGNEIRVQIKDDGGWKTLRTFTPNFTTSSSHVSYDCASESSWYDIKYTMSGVAAVNGSITEVRVDSGKDQDDSDESLSIGDVTFNNSSKNVLLDDGFESSLNGWTSDTGNTKLAAGRFTPGCSGSVNTQALSKSLSISGLSTVHYEVSAAQVDSYDSGEYITFQYKDDGGWHTLKSADPNNKPPGDDVSPYDCSTNEGWDEEEYYWSGSFTVNGTLQGVRLTTNVGSVDSDESLALNRVVLYEE